MPLELNIKPEDVEQLVKDSIMKAGFGAAVTEGVKKAMSGYNNPIDKAVQDHVIDVCRMLMREKYSAEITAAVATAIGARVTKEMIEKFADAAVEKIVRAAEDRY